MSVETVPTFGYGWGHEWVLSDLSAPRVPTTLHELADRHALEQTVRCYGWAIDENRFDVFAELLDDDVSFSGAIASVSLLDEVRGRDTLVVWLSDYMRAREDQLRHVLGNVLITEYDGQGATALAYLTLMSSTTAGTTAVATAFYRFTLVKRDDAWLVKTVYAGFDAPF